MKYVELIKMTKEALDTVRAPLRAREMRQKGEMELAKIEIKIAEAEAKISELSGKYPIDFDKVLDAIDDKKLLELRKEEFTGLLKELFDETPAA